MTTPQARPDWIMVGGPTPDGVSIIASKELIDAMLEHETERPSRYADLFGAQRTMASTTYTVTARMRDFVVVFGPDYPTALAALLHGWQPKPPRRRPVDAPPPALEG